MGRLRTGSKVSRGSSEVLEKDTWGLYRDEVLEGFIPTEDVPESGGQLVFKKLPSCASSQSCTGVNSEQRRRHTFDGTHALVCRISRWHVRHGAI